MSDDISDGLRKLLARAKDREANLLVRWAIQCVLSAAIIITEQEAADRMMINVTNADEETP